MKAIKPKDLARPVLEVPEAIACSCLLNSLIGKRSGLLLGTSVLRSYAETGSSKHQPPAFV
jgi:hypothetical protein